MLHTQTKLLVGERAKKAIEACTHITFIMRTLGVCWILLAVINELHTTGEAGRVAANM